MTENHEGRKQQKEALFRRIKRKVGQAIGDYAMISAGDRVLVAISGGKDSWTLLHMLQALQKRAPIDYSLVPVHVDAGFPQFRRDLLATELAQFGLTSHIETTEISAIIEEKLHPDTSYCAFCARLRRGVLYSVADRLGCNKVALGHHLDDAIETLLMNQFFVGRLAGMSPNMLADNGRHRVIRPLAYVEEADIAHFAQLFQLPVFDCGCPAEGLWDTNRQRIKQLITELSGEIPDIRRSMLRAMRNVQPRHLMDPHLVTEDESL